MQDIDEEKIELNNKQTKMVISQLKPHFLFNALNSIYYLCGKNPDLAKKAVLNFSKYLRTNMDVQLNNPMVPFEQELENVDTYLALENVRFANILTVDFDIEYTDFQLPALSLLPLVENAVRYGVRNRKDGGIVTISSYKEMGKIFVAVHDDGVGFDPQTITDDGNLHLGIATTRSRLAMLCNGKLEITSSPTTGTTATIILEETENSHA